MNYLKNKLNRLAMRAFGIRRERDYARGMTLIEIMVVIIILAMLATLVTVAVVPQLEQAKVDTARLQIRNFMSALEMYRIKVNKYPTTSEGLESLVNPPNNLKPFLNEIPKDPWSKDYVYVSPGSHGKLGFDISSAGPDGIEGNEDDVNSWALEGDKK